MRIQPRLRNLSARDQYGTLYSEKSIIFRSDAWYWANKVTLSPGSLIKA